MWGKDAYSTLQLSYGFPSGFQHYGHGTNFPQQVETKYHPRNDGISANICFGCGKRYKWRDSLLRHQRVECGNKEKKFCCKLCPKKFYHQYKLNEHYQGRHKLPKLQRNNSPGAAIGWYYHCQSLYLRLMAENHMAENVDDDEYSAAHSGNDTNELVASKKTRENGCAEASLTGNHANSNVRDLSIYTCPRCGNAYTRPHSLNRHIRFECGVEPQFECHICHKKSKHKHNLVLHMRTHQKH
ncbi:PREDICTED: zinc finger protein 37-like [Habropoda laboriosa]|uniref:zinc finger protein 37-like n=1 Tax=Habropoda laboriosa TaxID=597456 RepID=UPI00083E308C|nr:PREDICTED: zinc finger protein 37-like [Habropoda laboriosa]